MGRPPKDPSKLSRARDARRQRPWLTLAGGPTPPPRLRGSRRLHPSTRAWWRAWLAAPEAAEFSSTDWQRLEMLVPTVDAYFRGDLSLLSEIRLNEAKLSRRVPPAHGDDPDDEDPDAA